MRNTNSTAEQNRNERCRTRARKEGTDLTDLRGQGEKPREQERVPDSREETKTEIETRRRQERANGAEHARTIQQRVQTRREKRKRLMGRFDG